MGSGVKGGLIAAKWVPILERRYGKAPVAAGAGVACWLFALVMFLVQWANPPLSLTHLRRAVVRPVAVDLVGESDDLRIRTSDSLLFMKGKTWRPEFDDAHVLRAVQGVEEVAVWLAPNTSNVFGLEVPEIAIAPSVGLTEYESNRQWGTVLWAGFLVAGAAAFVQAAWHARRKAAA
jgi:hypothetical protein